VAKHESLPDVALDGEDIKAEKATDDTATALKILPNFAPRSGFANLITLTLMASAVHRYSSKSFGVLPNQKWEVRQTVRIFPPRRVNA
jgi:hypothetical protein